jgi:hypothetical protein
MPLFMDFGFAHHLFFRHSFGPAGIFREMMMASLEEEGSDEEEDEDYDLDVPDEDMLFPGRMHMDHLLHQVFNSNGVQYISDDDDDEDEEHIIMPRSARMAR